MRGVSLPLEFLVIKALISGVGYRTIRIEPSEQSLGHSRSWNDKEGSQPLSLPLLLPHDEVTRFAPSNLPSPLLSDPPPPTPNQRPINNGFSQLWTRSSISTNSNKPFLFIKWFPQVIVLGMESWLVAWDQPFEMHTGNVPCHQRWVVCLPFRCLCSHCPSSPKWVFYLSQHTFLTLKTLLLLSSV